MPINLGKDKTGCFARWGRKGAKYYYECGNEKERNLAKQKAIKQAIAIGEFSKNNISFDFDGVLTTKKGRELLQTLIFDNNIFVISTRNDVNYIKDFLQKHGIKLQNIYAVGSNNNKILKIKELNILKHYDNNPLVIEQIPNIGILFKE